MKTYLVGFAVSFLIAVITTPIIRKLSLLLGIVDAPDPERKVHKRPVPRTGGISLLVAIGLPMASFAFLTDFVAIGAVVSAPGSFRGVLIGAVIACALGLMDDMFGLSAWPKLIGQVAIAMVMFVFDFKVDEVGLPFLDSPIDLGWFALPATVLWYVAVMNAMNLIDGLDGLAAGIGLVTTLVLFVVAVVTANAILGTMTSLLAGGLAGFLVFNFNPAKIFLGDSGSLLLGFLLATSSVMTRTKGQTVLALFLPVVALGVPFLDMALAMIRRFASQRPIFQGDRKHIHHLLLEKGLSPRKVALILYGIAALFGILALSALIRHNALANALTILIMLVIVITLTRFLGYHRLSFLPRPSDFEAPESIRLRAMLLDLAKLPQERDWQAFTETLKRHGILGAHLLRHEGNRRIPIASMDEFPKEGGMPRLSSTFRVILPDDTKAEILFEWYGAEGRFAPEPHEEAFLRVAADMVRTLKWPPDGLKDGT